MSIGDCDEILHSARARQWASILEVSESKASSCQNLTASSAHLSAIHYNTSWHIMAIFSCFEHQCTFYDKQFACCLHSTFVSSLHQNWLQRMCWIYVIALAPDFTSSLKAREVKWRQRERRRKEEWESYSYMMNILFHTSSLLLCSIRFFTALFCNKKEGITITSY